MTRFSFHQQLDALWADLTELADRQVTAIERASLALSEANAQLATLVVTEQADTDELNEHLESLVIAILLQQQPVASDLRLVTACLPMGSALARMGGLAAHISKLTLLRAPQSAVAPPVQEILTEIGAAAALTASTLADATRRRDAATLASVESSDDAMDAAHRRLFVVLKMTEWPDGVHPAVDAALLGRYYERFNDQAVSVARRIVWITTGDRSSPR